MATDLRVGVFVDVESIARNGGYGMRYDVLRDFAARGVAGEPIRLNAYVAFDEERARDDEQYEANADNFHSALRDFGYKVIRKPVKWLTDEAGQEYGKSSADLDMAVDVLLQSDRLDRILVGASDSDLVKVVQAVQNKGCRVEVVGFDGVSMLLQEEADLFVSGYLVPRLLPTRGGDGTWGGEGSRVRGVCYSFSHDRGFGFIRYMDRISTALWNIDTRNEDSPYSSAFAHESEFPSEIEVEDLPSREHLFEFTLVTSDRGLQAKDITVVR